MESDNHHTFMRMTRNVPMHIKNMVNNETFNLHKVQKILREGLEVVNMYTICKKLPDIAYSYTKHISEMMDDDD